MDNPFPVEEHCLQIRVTALNGNRDLRVVPRGNVDHCTAIRAVVSTAIDSHRRSCLSSTMKEARKPVCGRSSARCELGRGSRECANTNATPLFVKSKVSTGDSQPGTLLEDAYSPKGTRFRTDCHEDLRWVLFSGVAMTRRRVRPGSCRPRVGALIRRPAQFEERRCDVFIAATIMRCMRVQ